MSILKKKLTNNQIDALILILGYLFCASFPFSLFIKNNDILVNTLSFVLILAYLLFIITFLILNKKIKINRNPINIKNILLISPSLVVVISNYFYLFFVKSSFQITSSIIYQLCLTVIVVTLEELLFRGILFSELKEEKPLTRILITSVLFGLCHISRFFSSFNPIDLLSVLYTFALGLVIGLLYEYGGSLISAIIFHFLFNFLNQNMFECFKIENDNYIAYILSNISIALIAGGYLLFIYLKILKKSVANN